MIYGYARTSTVDQKAGLDVQKCDLALAGCTPVYIEEASAVGERPVLDGILAKLQKGDQLVVTKLDRLARSVVHLGQLLEQIHAAGASLRILNLGMDTSTPTGKLMLNVLGSVAQFEREMMLERQADGIAAAKAAGKYRGRPVAHSHHDVAAAWNEGAHEPGNPYDFVGGKLGVSRRQAQRLVAAARLSQEVKLVSRLRPLE